MIKKLAVVAAVGLVGAGVVSQTRVGSHLASLYQTASSAVEEAVPPEIELERIRFEIGRLAKDIDKARGQLADQRVAVREQIDEVESLKADVAQREELLRVRGEAIKSGEIKVRYLGRTATVDEAKEMFATDYSAFQNRKKELATAERMLAVHLRNRAILERHVATLEKQKVELATAVKSLEADLKLLRLEQAENKSIADESRLGDINQSFKALKHRINVMREKENLYIGADSSASDIDVEAILSELGTRQKTADMPVID